MIIIVIQGWRVLSFKHQIIIIYGSNSMFKQKKIIKYTFLLISDIVSYTQNEA